MARGALVSALALGAGVATFVALPLPAGLLDRPAPTLELTDRAGVPLRTTRTPDGSLAQWLPLSEMDPELLVAFVAAEDRRFHEHHGVDPRAVARALLADLKAGRIVSGASTIPMQLARLLRPIPRTLPGKFVQGLWALRLDAHLSKQTLLEQYLNRVPLGQGAVGVEAAAWLYFGASARDLSTGQAALLAGVAGAPSRDNPLVSERRAMARRAQVLDRMHRAGLIGAGAVASAKLEAALSPAARAAFRAPHFTAALLARSRREGLPRAGRVVTELDLPLQEALEAEVRHTVETMRLSGVRHAAAVVLDNRSGGVLAWVGSPDFFEPTSGQVDMVISPRQPGSTLKPFLYGLAFDRGYSPASILPDIATVYQTGTGPYAPRNYDRRFHGPVRVREALGSSFNLPAVELAHRLGVAEFLATLQRAGFESLDRDPEHYGLGLSLGNGDVTLLELANGYRAIANGGRWEPVRLAPPGPVGESKRVMSEGAAALVLDVLADPVARIPGFGPVTPLEFPFPAAAKTGTSRHFTDNWAIAVTGGFTVAVWVGNFDGRPMEGVSGVAGAGPLLHRATLLVARRHAPGVLLDPEAVGARPVRICRLSGLRAGPECPSSTEWTLPGHEIGDGCDWHQGGRVLLPAPYAEWAASVRVAGGMGDHSRRRMAGRDTATSRFRIVSPSPGDVYRFVPGVDPRYASIGLRTSGHPGGATVRWWVDGAAVPAGRLRLLPGQHVIRARAGRLTDEVRIEVVGEQAVATGPGSPR
jgi:penicillin-binding protein 1C